MTEPAALSCATLERAASRGVDVPRYARTLDKRICHVGVGRFHRAHQAHYLHRLHQDGRGDGWGICAIGLRAADQPALAALRAQDGLYSLWEMDGRAARGTVIGTLMEHIDASADDAEAIVRIADPATRIVSLTVTEQGYCLDAGGALDTNHPDVAHDLTRRSACRSAPGLIVRGLAARHAARRGGLTLLSCDNLIENGRRLESAVLGFAHRVDPQLATWIEDEVSFPSSMVDRITPAADLSLADRLCADWGLRDAALVHCEPWQQWVVEDDFVAGRPPLEHAGVVFSDHVKPYEDAKVGLLNGGHSALCHAALLAGHTHVHEAMADTRLARWLASYMSEIAGTLSPPPGFDLRDYQASLLARFANPAIADRLTRLAQDTSAKFQQALLPPLQRRIAQHQPFERCAAALAAWIAYLDALTRDPVARATYTDARKDALIEHAAAAVARHDAAEFLATSLSLLPAQITAVAPRINDHLRGIAQAGSAAAHLATL